MTIRNQKPRRQRGLRRPLTTILWEKLEARWVLTGPYTNAQLNQTDMDALVTGLDGLSAYGRRMADSGYYAEPLKGVQHQDGTPVTIGEGNPLGRAVEEGVANPLRDYYAVSQPAQWNTDALVFQWDNESDDLVTSIDGGLVDGGLDEVRFEISVHFESEIALLDWDFGTPGHALGIGVHQGGSVAARLSVDVTYVFGILLDPGLNIEQRFFVRSLEVDTRVTLVAQQQPFDIGIGILEANVPTFSLTAQALVHSGPNTNTANDTVRLSDMNDDYSLTLLATELSQNNFSATFDVTASIGNWRLASSQFFQLVGSLIGVDPAITFSPGFEEALLFNRITPDELVSGMEQFGSWLSGLANVDAYDVSIPFTAGASMGSVVNIGQGMQPYIDSLRDSHGQPSFDVAQQFPYTDSLTYDPDMDQLRYVISQSLPTQRTSTSRTRVSTNSLLGLDSDESAEIVADPNVSYTLIFDLTAEGANIADRMLFDDFDITTTLEPTASGFSGRALYQSLGVEFSNAVLSGAYSVAARFGDPNPVYGPLSLNQLFARMNDQDALLSEPIDLTGTSELRVSGLSVVDNLVSLANSSASIVARLQDINSGSIEVSLENAPELAEFENLSSDSLLDSLTEAILGTDDWAAAGDDALATVDQTIEDYNPIRQDRIVETIEQAQSEWQRVSDMGRIVLQDVPGFLSRLEVATRNGAMTFSSNLVHHFQSGLNLQFSAEVEESSSAELGLGFESLFGYTSDSDVTDTLDFVGQESSVPYESTSTLELGLQMDVSDPHSPVAYLDDSSRMTTSIRASAGAATGNALSLDGASGSLGLQLTDGAFLIAQTLVGAGTAAPAAFVSRVPGGSRVAVNSLSSYAPQVANTGRMGADFGVIPDTTGALEPNRLAFRVLNLSNVGASTTLASSPSFPDLRAAEDLPNQMQSVGPSLDELFGKLEIQVQQQVLGVKLPLIGDALDGPANFIRKLHTELNAALVAITAFDVNSIETAIESAISRLLGRVGNYVSVDLSNPLAIRFTLEFTGAPINESVQTETDIGLPALGIGLDAQLNVIGSYDFRLDFVVSVVDGVYIDTSTEAFVVNLDVDMQGTASGRLGFIAVDVNARPSNPACGAFHAKFNIGLKDPSGDNKLKLNELDDGSLIDKNATGLTGCAGMRFDVTAQTTDWLPKFNFDLSVDWSFDGRDMTGSVPEITYGNVEVELGGFLAKVLAPLLAKLEPIIDPIEPVLDLLTSEIPVIDDLGVHVTLLDLAELYVQPLPPDDAMRQRVERLTKFIEALDSINDLANAVRLNSNAKTSLVIGSLTFGGSRSPQFDARALELASKVVDLAQTSKNILEQLKDGAPETGDVLKTTPAEIHFPIYENPLSVFEWLLGFGEAEIVTLALPGVDLNIPIDLSVTIFPGILSAGIFGSIEASVGLMVGLDTYGASQFKRSGDALDFLKGFYISDRENADGTGADIPELPIVGKALAGVKLGVDEGGVGLGVSVGGGITANLDFDLIDPDNDGKVRGHELNSPKGCLAIHGGLSASLEASATVLGLSYDFPFVKEELGSFNTVVHCGSPDIKPNATLAGLNPSNGELVLFVGNQATARSVEPTQTAEEFRVFKRGNQVVVEAFGAEQTFLATTVNKIFANAGSDNDKIIVEASITVPVALVGDAGDDYLQGGSGPDTLAGNAGNDTIYGGANDDLIVGNAGQDLIYGEDGADDLVGGDDDDELHGGAGPDAINTGEGVNLAYGDAGNDTLVGGSRRDVLNGGDDDDTLYGMAGRNVLRGDAGIDTIQGGDDADVIDGGAEGDFLYGHQGADRIYGGAGRDTIEGNEDDDYLEGNEDDDIIRGGADADTVQGNAGLDLIIGGPGDDVLDGNADDDEIHGGLGLDVIHGGSENDTLYGDEGDDQLSGDAGSDQINGGPGNDQLRGDAGNDEMYGNARSLTEDRSDPNFTDNDLMFGGDNNDAISGGWGSDVIYGENGNDTLQGNEDTDMIEGGAGNDTIYGQDAPDYLRSATDLSDIILGGDGNDTISGGLGADVIRGGPADDTIFGNSDLDELFGDSGNDTIDGGPDNDEIDGGIGNDRLIGSDGVDTIFGNDGLDILEGNRGDDLLRGNDQSDVLYGDEGDDELRGGTGNDTLRGGEDDDLLLGEVGDDLLLGFTGDDRLEGGNGDDVLYGNNGTDTLLGQSGNDRLYGELGDDTLVGDIGNDVAEGGAGDDTISGDAGNDALYGDGGIDELAGGDGDDLLIAGDGIGDFLRGDGGHDHLVGSDDGGEDPKPGDTTYFGDRLQGGDDDDLIEGLGGADEIDGGSGNNTLRGGLHVDVITGGIEAPLDVQFNMSQGPERRGAWGELSDSASFGGLTKVGGFEQSVLATDFGIYVAWVDWRNGNSEIYVAFHPKDVGNWTELSGFNGFGSASGGGISNDIEQSRRPTLFRTGNSDQLVVAWTSIKADGSSSIEVAMQERAWARVANPAQTGAADHAISVAFSDDSGLLAWIDNSTGTKQAKVAQFVYEPSCFVGFLPGSFAPGGVPIGVDVTQIDLTATEFQAAMVMAYGDLNDHDLVVTANSGADMISELNLCPAVANANVDVRVSASWRVLHRETTDDLTKPTIAIQLIEQRSQGQNEEELSTDVIVAWQRSNQRIDQVDGVVIRIPLSGPPLAPQQLIPEYQREAGPRLAATAITDLAGYATEPELAASYFGTYLAWIDDTTLGGDGDSSLYILSRFRDTNSTDYVLSELEPLDASGRGLSTTGRSAQSLTVGLDQVGFASTNPYVVWTEAAAITNAAGSPAPVQAVYLRVNQTGLTLVDDVTQMTKFGSRQVEVLANDLNLFGEIPGRIVQFDDRSVEAGQELQFVSELGAVVTVLSTGEVSYDPRGVAAFRRLRRGQSLSETFEYQVNNFVNRASANVTFTVNGLNAWNNLRNVLDVNDDGSVTALDALLIINELNTLGARSLIESEMVNFTRFIDVNDDGFVTAIDALLLINWLNGGR